MPSILIAPSRSHASRARATRGKPKPDRRRSARFPMALPVRYSLSKTSGWGRTVNIGSGGMLFTIDQPLRQGQRVELCIGWPVLLHEKVHLNLVASGTIVRAGEGCAAVRFETCAFRTASAAFRRQAKFPELHRAEPYG